MTDPDPDPSFDPDWLTIAWSALSDRLRGVLERRAAGDTLEEIAADVGVTRERVRQLQLKAEAALLGAQSREQADLPEQLQATLGDRPAVPTRELAHILPAAAVAARSSLLGRLGVSAPQTWAGDIAGYWTLKPKDLDLRLRQLASLAPMSLSEAHNGSVDLGIPAAFPLDEVLGHPGSRLTKHDLGWIRSNRINRDLAYLWLRTEGEPRPVSDIARVTGSSEHAIRERMRSDDDFAQVRPEGTWALTDWRATGAENRYSNAEETVIEVLRERGPMTLTDLRVEVLSRYPVSPARFTQCLSISTIGKQADGRYDLAERGATPVEDKEPRRPASIDAQGCFVGIRLDVNHDMMRGSGLMVHKWLTWHLGLRIAPSTRRFTLLAEPGGELTVKRASSNAQISSVRTAVQALNLVEGCKIAIVFNTDNDTAKLHHVCDAGECPAK